ncbi:MAG: hypothetical protein ACRCTD_17325 [Beijerinckiaceae bacterium]
MARLYGLRTVWLGCLAAVAMAGGARAEVDCLSSAQTQAAVEQRLAITPHAALKAARFHVQGGEALRARLCHHNDDMVYWVTVLGRDSKVTRVLIKALDGSMIEMR